MIEAQSGGSVAADGDLRLTVERHIQDIAELRQHMRLVPGAVWCGSE